jgi:hypothetical protein
MHAHRLLCGLIVLTTGTYSVCVCVCVCLSCVNADVHFRLPLAAMLLSHHMPGVVKFGEDFTGFRIFGQLLFVGIAAIHLIAISSVYRNARYFTLCTSIEMMIDREMVERIVREQKFEKCTKAIHMLHTLSHYMQTVRRGGLSRVRLLLLLLLLLLLSWNRYLASQLINIVVSLRRSLRSRMRRRTQPNPNALNQSLSPRMRRSVLCSMCGGRQAGKVLRRE